MSKFQNYLKVISPICYSKLALEHINFSTKSTCCIKIIRREIYSNANLHILTHFLSWKVKVSSKHSVLSCYMNRVSVYIQSCFLWKSYSQDRFFANIPKRKIQMNNHNHLPHPLATKKPKADQKDKSPCILQVTMALLSHLYKISSS